MNNLDASALAATTQTVPPFVAPLGIDHDSGYWQSTFGNEVWISPLDVTAAWEFGAPVREQVTVPVFGQFLPGYELPAGYVGTAALQDNSITDLELANGEGAPSSLPEEAGTSSRTSNPNERTSTIGRAEASRRSSDPPGFTASTMNPRSQPRQGVLDLGPIRNETTSSTDALQASKMREFIPYRDVRENDNQSNNPSPTEPTSTPAVALSTSSGSSLVRASPFSSTMTLSTLAQIDLYNARARNRVAANRCRIKQKASVAKVKEAERILMDERDHLLNMKKLLTDQVCGLKELLFMHAKCTEDRLIGEYLELTATRIVEMLLNNGCRVFISVTVVLNPLGLQKIWWTSPVWNDPWNSPPGPICRRNLRHSAVCGRMVRTTWIGPC